MVEGHAFFKAVLFSPVLLENVPLLPIPCRVSDIVLRPGLQFNIVANVSLLGAFKINLFFPMTCGWPPSSSVHRRGKCVSFLSVAFTLPMRANTHT